MWVFGLLSLISGGILFLLAYWYQKQKFRALHTLCKIEEAGISIVYFLWNDCFISSYLFIIEKFATLPKNIIYLHYSVVLIYSNPKINLDVIMVTGWDGHFEVVKVEPFSKIPYKRQAITERNKFNIAGMCCNFVLFLFVLLIYSGRYSFGRANVCV
jgi:hypothetical protein